MAAANTDKLTKLGNPGSATSLAAPGHTIGGSTFTVDSTSNWPTDTGVVFCVDTVTLVEGQEVRDADSYTVWEGVVTSATTIGSATLLYGDDQNYPAGSTTRVYIIPTTTRENQIIDALLSQHKQSGAHGAITADSVASSGAVSGTAFTGTTATFSSDVSEKGSTLSTIRDEYSIDFVASGGVWSGDSYGSTLAASMTAIVVYINGQRGAISAVTARAFTASKDTYVDVLNNSGTFSLVYTEVANNAASPALAADSIRIAIIVTGASNIANVGSINQGQENKVLPIASSTAYSVTDSLGNLICNRSPVPSVIGYRQITSNFTTTSGSATQITGLSVPVIVPSNRKVAIDVFAYKTGNNTGNVASDFGIWDGTPGSGTLLNQGTFTQPTGVTTQSYTLNVQAETTVSGSKTYNASCLVSGGTQTVVAGSTTPAFIRVRLV